MGYRKIAIGDYKKASCAICNDIDSIELFDVDHKIPQWAGGCDQPWNLWILCLKHHRKKTLAETSLRKLVTQLPVSMSYCFACTNIYSKYFATSDIWCLDCSKLLLNQRVGLLEKYWFESK